MSNQSLRDLRDSSADQEKLKAEQTVIDLPDVEDIPGQENITVPPLGELADTTIASADEEGEGLWVEEDEDGLLVIDNAGPGDEEDEDEEEEDDDKEEDDDDVDEDDEDDELDDTDVDEDELLDEDDEDEEDEAEDEGEVTKEERSTLQASAEYEPSRDEQALRDAELDNTDFDGEPLNESEDFSGRDLDVPLGDDERLDALGQGDEENDVYSIGGDRNEDNEEVRE